MREGAGLAGCAHVSANRIALSSGPSQRRHAVIDAELLGQEGRTDGQRVRDNGRNALGLWGALAHLHVPPSSSSLRL
ncbi:hypothetical protein MHYP_G00014970 [Metynnis hypsauchen]